MSLDRPQLKARKPTARVPYPFVLLEGEEGSGKSWAAAQLSASERVGRTFWLDLDEGTADEYGAIPGARFEVLEHDGTYAQVLEQVLAVREVARAAHAAGEPPVVLVIDTMLNVWDGLKDWVSQRAKDKPSNQRKLAQDPAAELDVSRNLWNDAGNRYRRLTNVLKTFPGIVVGITRGKWVSDTDPATGQPFKDGRKTYRIEGEKNLGYDATVILRMLRGQPPQITKARSVHAGVRPTDPPVVLEGKREPKGELLEWLIFDVLKANPGGDTEPRQLVAFTGGDLLPEERADEEALAAAEAEQRQPSRTASTRRGMSRDDAAVKAQADADKLAEQRWPEATVDAVEKIAADAGYIDAPVTFRGNAMTLGGALALCRVEAREDAARAAQAAEQPPAEPQAQHPDATAAEHVTTAGDREPVVEDPPEGAEEAVAAPQEPEQPPAGPPTQETPQEAAYDLARETLSTRDAELLRTMYRGSADLIRFNVLPVVTEDDLAALDAPQDLRELALGTLIMRVADYVERHGSAVREAVEPLPPTPPAGDDPWADDAAAGWPNRHTPAP